MLMKNLKKSSFTLIELIFAIVIVGIAVTSIPMLLITSANNTETNLQEKSFFNAYALVSLMQVALWDENNTKDDNYYKVLTADNGDSKLKCIRKGVSQLNNDSGATCASDDNKTSKIGPDAGEDDVSKYDDIDDFNGYETNTSDYIFDVSVRYLDDSADYSAKNIFFNEDDKNTNGTNMKFITIDVKNKKTKKLISKLQYSTSNIGMTKIESRNE